MCMSAALRKPTSVGLRRISSNRQPCSGKNWLNWVRAPIGGPFLIFLLKCKWKFMLTHVFSPRLPTLFNTTATWVVNSLIAKIYFPSPFSCLAAFYSLLLFPAFRCVEIYVLFDKCCAFQSMIVCVPASSLCSRLVFFFCCTVGAYALQQTDGGCYFPTMSRCSKTEWKTDPERMQRQSRGLPSALEAAFISRFFFHALTDSQMQQVWLWCEPDWARLDLPWAKDRFRR